MPVIPKEKKTSIAISLIDFVLAAGYVFCLLAFRAFRSTGTFDFNLIVQEFTNDFKAFNYRSLRAYYKALLVFLPLLGGILGLFGRGGRFFNICAFGSVLFALTSLVCYQMHRGMKLLDFSNLSEVWLSIGILAAMVYLILSTVNLFKSK